MELIASLAVLLGALIVGCMSPGPSFVLVARTAIASSRAAGIAAAVGMGVGGAIFSIIVLLGLHAMLLSVPWLYLVLKVAGGVYLLYLGICIWRGAGQPLIVDDSAQAMPNTLRKSFLVALGAQLGNPKTAVVYGSIFAALVPPDLSLSVAVTLPALVFIIETGWYGVVALVLSSAAPRAVYLTAKVTIDRTAGVVLGVLGLKLISAGAWIERWLKRQKCKCQAQSVRLGEPFSGLGKVRECF